MLDGSNQTVKLKNWDWDSIRGMLQQNVHPDQIVLNDSSPLLMHPLASGDILLLNTILSYGASPQARIVEGNAFVPLYEAIKRNDLKASLALLEAGADVNYQVDGHSYLYWTLATGLYPVGAVIAKTQKNLSDPDIPLIIFAITQIADWVPPDRPVPEQAKDWVPDNNGLTIVDTLIDRGVPLNDEYCGLNACQWAEKAWSTWLSSNLKHLSLTRLHTLQAKFQHQAFRQASKITRQASPDRF